MQTLFSGCALAALALAPGFAYADTPAADQEIWVNGQRIARDIAHAPGSSASITAQQIETTVNAVNIEDTLKYLPSLIVRKRFIGDTYAPVATRTSGLGSSARSLIYADGVLLSTLIGNNNGSASPRWSMVSPEEVARIDVLYGPFSAAYAGNSIGTVITITTRLPDHLEGTLSAGTSLQTFDQYGTKATLPAYQFAATLGDRFGPLALFGSWTRTTSNSQPETYVTASRGANQSGGYDDVNRTNAPIRVLGASGLKHQVQDTIKLKAALDVTPGVRLTYVGGLFRNDADVEAETYLRDAAGVPFYTGAFSSGVYRYDERHWSHALSAKGGSARFDWDVTGTLYDFAKDIQRTPDGLLPDSRAGGVGTIADLKGTGWKTLDAKGAWRPNAAHVVSFGAHWDRFVLNSNRYGTTDWIDGPKGMLQLTSRGKTRTAALWAQDAWRFTPALTLTLGGRYEWWKAFDGYTFSVAPALTVNQPRLEAKRFSPKASLAWEARGDLTVRLSLGQAYRFPTVGELYQAVTTGPVLTVPNPNLRPEKARSGELAIEHHDAHGTARLSLFGEIIDDALISQSAPLVAGSSTLYSYVQNIPRTRARGVEAAVQRSDFPLPGLDLTGSVTYADARTVRDPVFPSAIGKQLPGVPKWKAAATLTWHPQEAVALTAAARYASRIYGTLNNSDIIGNTYQGFYKYLVLDLRATFAVTEQFSLALGVDNLNNDRYFLFHPFPQRTFNAEAKWRL